MNLDNNVTTSYANNSLDYKEVGAKINQFLVSKGKTPFNLKQISNDAILENQKSFTGAAAATGQGLIETRVSTPLVAVTQRGGVFIESGINYKPESGHNVTFNGFQLNGTYAQIACGTDTANEISTFSTGTATLLRERAEIAGCEDVLARTPDANSAISIFEQALEEEKLRLSDLKSAVAVTSNASVAAINLSTAPTYGPITWSMLQMIANISGYDANIGAGHAFYVNQQGFSKLLKEQDQAGNYQNSPQFSRAYFEKAYGNGRRPSVGLVGYFDGFPVYLTNGILNTYTDNASNVITAQTGGTKTAVLFGITGTLGLARGMRQYDSITVFDSSNDRQSYLEGEVTIGSWTYMASVVIIPAFWNYATIA